MRIVDLLENSTNKFDIEEKAQGENIVVLAISRGEKTDMVCKIVISDATIIQIELDDEASNKSDAMLEVLQYICKRQDEQNLPLAVVIDGIKSSMKRKLQSFGFVTGEDNIMVRRPGAVLPIAFI